jgi:hypothetical protein
VHRKMKGGEAKTNFNYCCTGVTKKVVAIHTTRFRMYNRP